MFKLDPVKKFSFTVFAAILLILGWLHLLPPFVAILFSILTLNAFKFRNRKWIAVTLYIIVVALIFYGFGYFINQAFETLPSIISRSMPLIVEFAREWGFEVNVTDPESLRAWLATTVEGELGKLARFAWVKTEQFVFLVISLVVAVSLFVNSKIDLAEGEYEIKNNAYTLLIRELGQRFQTFFRSFNTVMGAQIVISAINTSFTSVFLYAVGMPYFTILAVLTFLVGLLPIIGNLISNAVIFCVAITVSTRLAVFTLIYLIVIHKLEYFLNSKIIGGRIKSPMWLTLIGLVVGERVAGVPGMILAPVILHYLRIETSQIRVQD